MHRKTASGIIRLLSRSPLLSCGESRPAGLYGQLNPAETHLNAERSHQKPVNTHFQTNADILLSRETLRRSAANQTRAREETRPTPPISKSCEPNPERVTLRKSSHPNDLHIKSSALRRHSVRRSHLVLLLNTYRGTPPIFQNFCIINWLRRKQSL